MIPHSVPTIPVMAATGACGSAIRAAVSWNCNRELHGSRAAGRRLSRGDRLRIMANDFDDFAAIGIPAREKL